MKKFLIALVIVLLLAVGLPAPAFAATEGGVSITVTAKFISLTVSDGNVTYGVMDLSATQNTTNLGDTQVVTNNGNVNEKFEVKSSDAIDSGGGTDWTLGGAPGTNVCKYEWSPGASTWYVFATDTYHATPLASSVAPVGSANLDLQLTTPSEVTDGNSKTITVTVLATAA